MANPEHLEILEQGVEVWNEWRDQNPAVTPNLKTANLEGADLKGADLTGANLHAADLKGADLSKARLEGAKLSDASLREADFRKADLTKANLARANLASVKLQKAVLAGADLSEANLTGANLSDAELGHAKLDRANLNAAKLLRANLIRATLKQANLGEANLTGADLTDANLNGAGLGKADLSGAILMRTKLEDANLRYARNYHLDDTFVRSTRFNARARDPWSVLRRNYTGPIFLFHVIFLMVFLGVYSGKAMIWVGVNLGQSSLETVSRSITEKGNRLEANNREVVSELQRELDQIWNQESLNPKAIAKVSELIDSKIIQPGLQIQTQAVREITTTLNSISACLQSKCRDRQPVWRVLLQVDEGLIPMALAVALIVYNAIRWWFTRHVGFLRDAEERSDYSPFYREYKWIYLIHMWVMWPLFAVAVASLLFNAYVVLFETTVILPAPELAASGGR